jgi:condensin complex subunit 3
MLSSGLRLICTSLPPRSSEDLFFSLRTALLERARDKEVAVRVQAVLGLVAFLDAETADEDEEDVVEVLLEIMSADPSAFVVSSDFP